MIQNLLLTQHVDFPTRTPHILDLVITDGQFVEHIEELAPLSNSDHSVLIIETCLTRWQSQSDVNIGYNYDSGNYDDFRSLLTCDWDYEFKAVNNQVDEI